MPSIVIGNNQNRTKDCFAGAPVIDLTLRSNGEEVVQVMDSQGQFVPAGILSPSGAPALAIGSAPGLTPSQWITYVYVYVCSARYPLVENAVTGGGSQAPRSNSSPIASIQTDAAAGGKKVVLTLTNSTRVDVDKMWIYRTDYFLTQVEAEASAAEGLLYFVAEITNIPIVGVITYSDNTVTITGNELIEIDNYQAQQFQVCRFIDPYFYGFGNNSFIGDISVTATGLVTLTDADDKWFDGRNGQLVSMQGINSGGFDGYGGYYFKYLTNQTGQLYFDSTLTTAGTVEYTGTTQITIKGPSTNLYRSKPRNPFSWGETNQVNDIDVPEIWVRKVGGGQGTAMSLVPVANLLKLDTEAPNRTYVFNLNAQGTPGFDASKREISSDYSVSNHWAQFVSKDKDKYNYLWFLDTKFRAVCRSDGSNNIDVSDQVFASLRNITNNVDQRTFAHGIYEPNLQLNCLWFTSGDTNIVNNTLLIYHYPTDTWTTLEQRGILCSTDFFDRVTGKQLVLIGTEMGQIGWAFHPDYTWDWLDTNLNVLNSLIYSTQYDTTTTLLATGTYISSFPSIIGIWGYLMCIAQTPVDAYTTAQNGKIIGSARVSAIEDVGSGFQTRLIFDKFLNLNSEEVIDLLHLNSSIHGIDTGFTVLNFYPGMIFCSGCKFINADSTDRFKLNEVRITADGVSAEQYPIYFSLQGLITPQYTENSLLDEVRFAFRNDAQLSNGNISNVWLKTQPMILDVTRGFRIQLQEIGYGEFTIYNWSLAIPSHG